MTEQKFRSEILRAETMLGISDLMMGEYLTGYIRGLRRAYHGEIFGTAEDHERWMGFLASDYPDHVQRGQGYRDGLAYAEVSSVMGRPPIGKDTVCLDKITVPEELKAAIEAKAAEQGISAPEARREAYRQWVSECRVVSEIHHRSQ
jgi:hypothetical protein